MVAQKKKAKQQFNFLSTNLPKDNVDTREHCATGLGRGPCYTWPLLDVGINSNGLLLQPADKRTRARWQKSIWQAHLENVRSLLQLF